MRFGEDVFPTLQERDAAERQETETFMADADSRCDLDPAVVGLSPYKRWEYLKTGETSFDILRWRWPSLDQVLKKKRNARYYGHVKKAEKAGDEPSISSDLLDAHEQIGEEEWSRLERYHRIDTLGVQVMPRRGEDYGAWDATQHYMDKREEDILCTFSFLRPSSSH
jgi:hypothetical protein